MISYFGHNLAADGQSKTHKIRLFIVAFLIVFCGFLARPGKVHADCGISSGSLHDYAGMLFDLWWQPYGSAGFLQANSGPGLGVHIDTANPYYTPGGNIIDLNTNQRLVSADFNLRLTGVPGGGAACGGGFGLDNIVAVLGRGFTSWPIALPGTAGHDWALDCDWSLRVGAGLDPGNPFQHFIVTGIGVPTGARPGGWWDSADIAPANGTTAGHVLVYHEPAPPSTSFNLTPVATAPSLLPNNVTPSSADFSPYVKTSSAITVKNVPNLTRNYYVIHAAGGPNTPIGGSPRVSTRSIPPGGAGYNFTPLDSGIALPAGLVAGDRVCETMSSPDHGTMDLAGNILTLVGTQTTAPICTTVASSPYIRVFGGDIIAGSSDGVALTTTGCTGWGNENNTSGIYGFVGAADPSKGSVTQLGILSLGPIKSFDSAALRTAAPLAPKGLDFANTPTNGGLQIVHCPYDYFGNKPAVITGAIPSNIGTMASNNYYQTSGNATFGPVISAIANGTVLNIYVNGNVAITKNIVYAGASSWSSLAQVPRLQIVAKGNIYITGNVTQLDGIYIAQGGTIFTCATVGGGFYVKVPAANLYSSCNNQLTVNGSLVATSVKLSRTIGSITDNVGLGRNEYPGGSGPAACFHAGVVSTPNICAAEIINFDPEFYISSPSSATSNTGPVKFDYISALQPLL